MKSRIDRTWYRIWLSVGINAVVLALLLLFLRPVFEENDDITISIFANGALGEYSPYIVFENYFLGILYRMLYQCAGSIPWYAIVQYICLFASFSVITYIFLTRFRHAGGIFLSGLMLAFYGYECYIRLQFTKTSGVMTIAGVLLIITALVQEKIRWRPLAIGMLIGCVGSWYRFNQFMPCAALLSGILLYEFLERGNIRKREGRTFLLRVAIWLILLVCAAVLSYQHDKRIYNSDPAWQEYVRNNTVRSQLMDYGLPDYAQHEELYNTLGLGFPAYRMYAGWDTNDPDVLTADVMKSLAQGREKQASLRQRAVTFIKEVLPGFFAVRTFYFFLLAALLGIISAKRSLYNWIAWIFETGIFLLAYFYIFCKGRYLINRVDTGWWLAAGMVFLWQIDSIKMRLTEKETGFLLLTVLLLNQHGWRFEKRSETGSLEKIQQNRELIEEAGADPDHLYLCKVRNTLTVSGSYGPFDQIEKGLLGNITWLGGWEVNSIPYKDILRKYGIENPFRDMINNQAVYLLDGDINATLDYIRMYYCPDAQAVEAGKLGDLILYQIRE